MLLSLIPYLFSPHESMYYIKAVLANLNILDDLKGRSGKQREASCCRQKPRLLEVSRISSQLSPGKFWPWQPSRETQTTSSRPPRLPTLLCFVHEVKEAWLVVHLVLHLGPHLVVGVWQAVIERVWEEWEATEPLL